MILSEGVPMTNGEVFALLRRRRDERNAKLQPSFGMQFVGCSTTSSMQQQQQQQQRGSVLKRVSTSSAHTNFFFPPEALLLAEAQRSSVNGVVPLPPMHSLNNALFTSPTASHLIVLLTEVRALRYLSQKSTISGVNSVQALYGPTSIHNRCYHSFSEKGSGCEEIQNNYIDQDDGEENLKSSNKTNSINICHAIPIGCVNGELEALEQAVRRYRPGTFGHVRAVDSLLLLWEMNGQEMERQCALKIKSALRTLTERLGTPNINNGTCSPANNTKNEEEYEDQQEQVGDRQRLPFSDQPRLLFETPSVPLAMFLSDQCPNAASAAVAGVGRDVSAVRGTDTLQQQQQGWMEQDVLRLVMARPKESIDLHRLVDDLDERVGQNEELYAFIENELLQAFL